MKRKSKKGVEAAVSAAGKSPSSKGKRHHVHAESLENIAAEFDGGPAYPTGQQIAKWFRKESARIRSILR